MPRFIVTIRKPGQPQAYYLSRSGFRCYTAKNVAVLKSQADAEKERDHFAALMAGFELAVERLPARVRSIEKAVLSAVPV